MRLSMRVTIKVFLTSVVVATCPFGYTQGDNVERGALGAIREAQTVSTEFGSSLLHDGSGNLQETGGSKKKFAEARKSCTSAVTLAEALPAKEWRERSVAYSMRGQAELSANAALTTPRRTSKKAIEIDGRT